MLPDDESSVFEYLGVAAPEVPPEFIANFLDAYESVREVFTPVEQIGAIIRLVHAWELQSEKKIICHASEGHAGRARLPIAIVSVLAADWSGMADSVIAAIHDYGWNVFFNRGQVLSYKGHTLGVILMVIRFGTDEEQKRYLEQKPKLLERINRSAYGSMAKSMLLAYESRKLEMFSRVVEHFESVLPPERIEEVTGPKGEAVKFFASRSAEYICERAPEDLVNQIIVNDRFLKATRATGGGIQYEVENMKTVREELTTVTISALERDVDLEDCLQSIEHALGRFRLKYNKEFTTGDGITVFRIEIIDVDGGQFQEAQLELIRSKLAEMERGKRFERTRWIESIGGFEVFARAIIPLLVREYLNTSIPQVFLSVSKSTSQFIYFKILIVGPPSSSPGETVMFRCIPLLNECDGLLVQTTKPPKEMEGWELNILDLRADMSRFESVEMVFHEIREILAQVIGEFRDFDEGMRRSDKDKLKEVRSRLPGLDENFLKECYYRIEDFYRVSAPVEELVAIIEMASKALAELEKPGKRWSIKHRTLSMTVDEELAIPTASVLVVALYTDRSKLRKCLETLEQYDYMMSRIDSKEIMVLLFRITEKNKPLSDHKVSELIAAMKQICRQ